VQRHVTLEVELPVSVAESCATEWPCLNRNAQLRFQRIAFNISDGGALLLIIPHKGVSILALPAKRLERRSPSRRDWRYRVTFPPGRRPALRATAPHFGMWSRLYRSRKRALPNGHASTARHNFAFSGLLSIYRMAVRSCLSSRIKVSQYSRCQRSVWSAALRAGAIVVSVQLSRQVGDRRSARHASACVATCRFQLCTILLNGDCHTV